MSISKPETDEIKADSIKTMDEKTMMAQIGSRCSEYEPMCFGCIAWHIWDLERELSGLKERWDDPL